MGLSDNRFLGESEIASVMYHDLFDYPLSFGEIIKWRVGKKGLSVFKKRKEILNKEGLYFLKDRHNLLYSKSLRKRVSSKKVEIAKKAALLLSKIPTVKGVFITGALAMNNTNENSDIDLMVVTKRNFLWTTRFVSYLLLKLLNIKVRKPNDRCEKDRLCLNIWLDESGLFWNRNDRNIYSAHEIAQINPVIDKDGIYQEFLQKNIWIFDYWPNSVRLEKTRRLKKNKIKTVCFLEKICYFCQYNYMKNKITKEKVSLHMAVFHPKNWGKVVLDKLSS